MFTPRILDLAEQVVRTLESKGYTISTAESCTGGLIIGALTEISGSSAVVDRGFITYTNEAKMQMVNVCSRTLEEHGAVSSQTVIEMAEGAKSASEKSIAVAVSGIAGPTGGSGEKPVGLVHWALATDGHTLDGFKVFKGDREAVRLQTIETVLQLVLDTI